LIGDGEREGEKGKKDIERLQKSVLLTIESYLMVGIAINDVFFLRGVLGEINAPVPKNNCHFWLSQKDFDIIELENKSLQ